MLTERLNDLSDPSIENKIAKLLSCKEEIKEFAAKICGKRYYRDESGN